MQVVAELLGEDYMTPQEQDEAFGLFEKASGAKVRDKKKQAAATVVELRRCTLYIIAPGVYVYCICSRDAITN